MKPILTLTLLLFSLVVNAQSLYTIEGSLKGVEDGAVLMLCRNDGSVLSTISTDTLRAGKFTFRGKVDQPEGFMITGQSAGFPSMWLDVWVAPKVTVKISGSNKLLKTWTVQSSLKEQKELNKFTEVSRLELDKLQKLVVQGNELSRKEKSKDPIEKKKEKRIRDSIYRMQDSLNRLISSKEVSLLQVMPISNIWIDKLKSIARQSKYEKDGLLRKSAINLYDRLSPSQKESENGYAILAFLYPPKVVKKGDPMADTVFNNLAGQKRSLSDYKGKYLLLDFWSIGCGPCIASFPEMKQISEKYKDQLTVVSVSVDVKKALWQKASELHHISWENLSDGKGMAGIAAKYGIGGIPYYVVISPEGTVVDSWMGYGKGELEANLKKSLQ